MCRWFMVEFTVLNPACSRGWFSFRVFVNSLMITFEKGLHLTDKLMGDDNYVGLVGLLSFHTTFIQLTFSQISERTHKKKKNRFLGKKDKFTNLKKSQN